MRRSKIILLSALILTGIIPSAITPANVYAVDCTDNSNFNSQNEVLFFSCETAAIPCSTGSSSLASAAPTSLTGASNAEKVWNYFTARGLSPVAAAGAMGNIEQESSFDPWAGEAGNNSIDKGLTGVGFGLIQWTNTGGNSQGRRYGVMNYLETNGVSLDSTNASQNDQALLYELNWLWDGEYSSATWQEKVNSETSVSGDTSIGNGVEENTGNGSALLFHALVERSADDAAQKQERIDSAQSFLDTFGGGAMDCSMGEGGLTYDQAVQFMQRYGENVNGYSARISGNYWGYCNGGGSNCVTFSRFFNAAFTDMKLGSTMGDGKEVVNNLRARGNQTGSEPRVFSTFSGWNAGYGHTGIILGIHDGKVIVGHASCQNKGIGKGNGTGQNSGSGWALEGDLGTRSPYLGYNPTGFAYPTSVNTAAIMEFINKGYVE